MKMSGVRLIISIFTGSGQGRQFSKKRQIIFLKLFILVIMSFLKNCEQMVKCLVVFI